MQFDANRNRAASQAAASAPREQALSDAIAGATHVRRHKRRKSRNLVAAVTLRPAEIFELYGIPTSTLWAYCTDPDPTTRLPSIKIEGRNGRKGARYVNHEVLKKWMAQRNC